MNSFKNFIKLVRAFGVCFFASVFLSSCASTQTAQNPLPPAATSSPSEQISTSVEQMPQLVSSHGRTSGDQATRNLGWRLADGKQKTFSDYSGKVVILDFWATYCPPCEEEIPHLVELSTKYQKDLQVVGLHVGGAEDKLKIADFVTKYRMSYDLGYPEQDLMDFYLQGDSRIPQTLVFDRQGQFVQKFVGFTPKIKAELDQAVQTALAQ